MQFVWVYWHGGARSDELRWSIRSVIENYRGAAKVLVVGDKPPWYSGPHLHVKRVRPGKYRAFRDSLNKLIIATASKEVDGEFVWMMDDIYFNRPVSDEVLKMHYFQGVMTPEKLETQNPKNKWQRLKFATFRRLHFEGKPMRDYATHLPQFVEKAKFKKMVRDYDPSCSKRLMLWEVLYGNLFASNIKPSKDVLHRTLKKQPYTIYKRTSKKFINNGNKAWNESLRGYLWETFPNQSPYETSSAARPFSWYRGDKPKMTNKTKVIAVLPYRESGDRSKSNDWVRGYLNPRCDSVVFADFATISFNRSASINLAVRKTLEKTDYDPNDTIVVISDADCVVTGRRFNEAIAEAYKSNRLVIPHDSVCRMTLQQSNEILSNKSPIHGPTGRWFRSNRSRQCVSGVLVIKLSKFFEVNGFDETFVGWGGEDNAFFHACNKLLGESVRLDGPLYHFWHEKSSMESLPENTKRYLEYKDAGPDQIVELIANGYTKGTVADLVDV